MTQPVILRILGFSENASSHKEKIISAVGGFIGILVVILVSQLFVGGTNLVPSIGATAVLLFAAPHGQLAQPWNVAAGHVISAVIGVTCAIWIPDITLAAAAGVGIAIGVMHLMRCIHPPGGATALVAVVGGEQVRELCYQFVMMPVLINVLAILLVAWLFNGLFKGRHYPAFLHNKKAKSDQNKDVYAAIKHEDFVYALSEIDSFVDVTEEDLLKIYSLATGNKNR
jgi:CBS-domain-containing membrane protein